MWRNVFLDPGLPSILLNQDPDHFSGDSLATHAEEEFASRSILNQVGTTSMKVIADGLGCLPTYRDHSLLGALAENPGKTLLAVNGRHGQGANLRNPKATAVHQLEDGLVALA